MQEFASIFKEKYNSALISDAAFRADVDLNSAPSNVSPISPHMKMAGPIFPVQANNDLVTILAGLHRAKQGDVLIITNPITEVALIGDLIATEAKRKGLAGIVVEGFVRDTMELIDINVPIFSKGTYPVGPLKLPQELKGIGHIGAKVKLGDFSILPGSWVFGDADGAIFVSQSDLPKLFEEAEKAYQREESIANAIRSGASLGELLDIESFIKKREANPEADFNQHIAQLGRAI
ncbi:MAG: RraA family protein [Chloroflexota bacterium]